MPSSYSIRASADLYGIAQTVLAGYAVCRATDGKYVTATTANLATAGGFIDGIARTTGTSPTVIEVQVDGVIEAGIAGIGTSSVTRQSVSIDANGKLQRGSTGPGPVIGECDALGNVYMIRQSVVALASADNRSALVDGAVLDGATNNVTSVTNSLSLLASGGRLTFNRGTAQLDSTLFLTSPNIEIRGLHRDLSILQAGSASTMLQFSGAADSSANIIFEDITLDGANLAAILFSMNGSFFKTATFRRCRFIRYLQGVILSNTRNVTFDSCDFDNYGVGTVGTAVTLSESCTDIRFTGCTFRNGSDGIIISGTSVGLGCDRISIQDCDFDGQFYFLPPLAGWSQRSGATYNATGIVDATGDFTTLAQYTYLRAFSSRATGTADGNNKCQLVHSTAAFLGIGALEGELVECGGCWGVIKGVQSNSTINIEGWIDKTTLQPSFPSSNAYTVWKIHLMSVGASTTTTATAYFDHWLDLNSADAQPPPGSLYDAVQKANYQGVHTSGQVRNVQILGCRFRRSWSDQVSIGAGSDCIIANNIVERGQDTGITLNGTGHIVTGNKVYRHGADGIYVGSSKTNVSDNHVIGWRYLRGDIGSSYPEFYGIKLFGSPSSYANVARNYLDAESKSLRQNGMIVATYTGAIFEDNNIQNLSGGSQDIVVIDSATTGCEFRHHAVIGYPGAGTYFGSTLALGQMSMLTGSGTPEGNQTALIGSMYRRTDTGQLYMKTSGTGNTGWTVQA